MVWLPAEHWRDRRLGGLPAGEAGDAALRLFCTPQVSQWRHPDYVRLVARARYHLRNAATRSINTAVGKVCLHTLEPDADPQGTVLCIHGWISEASFMTALAEPMRRAGYRCVLMDMPGHGLSEGRATNLIDCARATVDVVQETGPLAAVAAHSFGGMVALLAMEGGAPLTGRIRSPRIVLVATPNRLAQINESFAVYWGLSRAGLRAFEQRLERIGRRPISAFSSSNLLKGCETDALLLHARDDDAVPFSAAEEIAAEAPRTKVLAFDGLGHRNILFAPQVARAAVQFLRQK